MLNGDEERPEGWRWASAFTIRWFIPEFLKLAWEVFGKGAVLSTEG